MGVAPGATVGIVSPGAMGGAVGAAYAAGGARVVATVAGRSERTRRLAAQAGLELLPGLADVVRESGVVLSIVPPEHAGAVAEALVAAARDAGAAPLVADLNAISPARAQALGARLAAGGLELVDGSISGPPPRVGGRTRLYLSGGRAGELASLPARGLEPRVVGGEVGVASAVKMSTASVYKGSTAVLAHALLAARAHGVLEHVLDDLGASLPQLLEGAGPSLARAGTKAHRYVAEMREIAAAQEAAGLPRELFEGFAAAYAAFARSELGASAPESIQPDAALDDVLARLAPPA